MSANRRATNWRIQHIVHVRVATTRSHVHMPAKIRTFVRRHAHRSLRSIGQEARPVSRRLQQRCRSRLGRRPDLEALGDRPRKRVLPMFILRHVTKILCGNNLSAGLHLLGISPLSPCLRSKDTGSWHGKRPPT